jgi:predicted transcriptional regulator
MSSDNPDDAAGDTTDTDENPIDAQSSSEGDRGPRDRLGEEADRAIEQFDQGIVDLLSWILDTETRARIYVYLRQNPGSTSEEIAEGTGLYPSTVREALAELHEEEMVTRQKRQSEGAGNNPYEYTTIAPSELVGGIAGQVQKELNTVFNLDRYLGHADSDPEHVPEDPDDPVTITVDDAEEQSASSPASQAQQDAETQDAPEDGDEERADEADPA